MRFLAASVVGVLVVGAAFFMLRGGVGSYPEAATIASGADSFKVLSDRFDALAKTKGALYAYDILRRATLPPGTDLHLLGHVVGDELYKQKGIDGVAFCTQEFRNACSHSIVVGALTDYGDAALSKIRDACKAAPGGPGAYTMCYHGLGHGVFAFFEYDIPKTVAFCKKTGTPEYHDEEYIQCVGGAIMELMGGGGHNHEAWLKSREKYLTKKDPLSPCDLSILPPETKGFCYTYITPQLFESAGADLANPQPIHFKKSFGYCDRIPASQKSDRQACFGGIGKEFPLLAVARDTRALLHANESQLSQMRQWCKEAPHQEAYQDCTNAIVDSLFWGGENDPHLATNFCALTNDSDADQCFAHIYEIARQYARDPRAAAQVCAATPETRQSACRAELHL